MGSYDLDGKTERLPRGTTTANLAERIPAGATNVRTAESNNRNEIFVTVGEPTTTLFQPTGKGIELVPIRSEEHTSELQSLMRISYAVFCLKKKKKKSLTYNLVLITSIYTTHVIIYPHLH